jgi:hypothetical protein
MRASILLTVLIGMLGMTFWYDQKRIVALATVQMNAFAHVENPGNGFGRSVDVGMHGKP